MPFDQVNFVLPVVETDDVLRCLIDGRERITTGWCRFALAKDGAGRLVGPDSPNAQSFCVMGAVIRRPMGGNAIVALMEARKDGRGLPCFNNSPTTTHADVLALFDRAIAARRAAIASKAG